MPSQLLRRWSGSRAGCGLPGSEPTPQPRAGIAGKTGRRRQSCATACARPLRPEDTVQVQAVRVGVWLHPPAQCLAEGAGGWRRAEGERRRERGRERGRREGGGRGERAGERALTLAPPNLRLVLATSRRDDQEKLARARFPTGIKQVMA